MNTPDTHQIHPCDQVSIDQEVMASMIPMDILVWPHQALSERCEAITDVNMGTRSLAMLLIKTMYANKCVGLAANQIGINKRIIAFDLADQMEGPEVIINPVISHGCQMASVSGENSPSFPGLSLPTGRWNKIRLTGLNLSGEPVEVELEGQKAICVQQCIDQINGVPFFHKAVGKVDLKLRLYLSKIRKRRRKGLPDNPGRT